MRRAERPLVRSGFMDVSCGASADPSHQFAHHYRAATAKDRPRPGFPHQSGHELLKLRIGHVTRKQQFCCLMKLREKVLGPNHPDTLDSGNNLALALRSQGNYAEAETQLREVIKLKEKVLGRENPSTLSSRNNLAATLHGQGKYPEAETQYREVIAEQEEMLGPDHPNTLNSLFNLALCLKAEMKLDDAREYARCAAEGATRVFGANHPDTLEYQKLWQELQQN